ncbi:MULTISPECIES: type I restriction endonuclease subunit R [Pseudomonas]|jgi:type I restriction enzyme, R subunit|uniref:Type I restriction endonuclease subunit R n=1 Tax=Pseudomonas extremaustralis TaxID=359110 RepID=A0A5C5QEX9_9PSED|nr:MULTISPECIES: type I restriction endonuclease [Pseudomonas]EZI30289.1 restriction endonuclease [Pseudomonas extremaustralis 14-3 substr. 14-3b]TWS03867.1 type I restriction endonuclease subunit R [Pseudomonas extremaustralis]SDG22506.1 type I restriction enzyme, R subunit [Pseudomonas extremaustralis]
MSHIHHECELERHIVEQLAAAGWLVGKSADYDAARALFPDDVLGWLEESQPQAMAKLHAMNGTGTRDVVLDRLVKQLENKVDGGTVNVLRYGFAVAGGGTLAMSQGLPEDDRNETVIQRYASNRLRVVPQLRFSLDKTDEIDLAFFINGIPVATVELKTDFTQSVQAAMQQYRMDRKPERKSGGFEPLLTFKRGAVVHFAMSDSDIRMTTKLAGDSTFFLPFNRGNDGAAGNPPGDNDSYPVSYLWKRVLQKDNWLHIFHRYVLQERKEAQDLNGKTYFKEGLIFPRFHQWEGVTKMIDAVRIEGAGQPYLIQHSAGSGKTNTIAWTAHSLIRVRRPDGEPYFHSVIVVTDRQVLDQQLQDAIQQIEHQAGVVCAIDRQQSSLPKSQQLAKAMLDGVPIIVCTLQTFPYAQKAILGETSLRDRRFAIIIDEAHSSTGGSTADDLRYVLTGQSEDEWDRLSKEERLSVWQSSRSRPGNASYFAFTATPKHSTLSLFGRPRNAAQPVNQENPPAPFHLYTMQQAIEEGFILDVLKNYTGYNVAFKIGSEFVDDKRVDEKSARRKLAKWLSLNPVNVGQKVELIVEHFRKNVAHLLGGQAKAMVVTSSRAAAVKYHLALLDYCQRKGYDNVQAMVAFSGEVPNSDVQETGLPADHQFSETNLNPGLNGRDMRKVFDTPDYRVMIVANKYQTGFDQPKLVAMYLDKKISGVEAVQTLSRLNRTFPGKDKTYVIDFANEAEEILAAFKTFYRDAQVADIQDPNIVYDIKQRLDGMFIYEAAEVEAFGEAIVNRNVTHQKLYSLTQSATDRFNGKLKTLNDGIDQWEKAWEAAHDNGDEKGMEYSDVQRAEYCMGRDELMIFSESLTKFVRTYEYIAQLVEFGDPALEAFASYARLLRKRLKGVSAEQVDLDDLKLSHYKIKKGEGLAGLSAVGEAPELYGITDNGLRDARDREKKYLTELIEKLNNAFGKDITDTDQVAFAVHVSEKLRGDTVVMAQVQNNTMDQAMKADLPSKAIQAIASAMSSHTSMATKLLSDESTRDVFLTVVYELLKKDAGIELLSSTRTSI